MKYRRRDNAYIASNLYIQLDPIQAYSYGWWKFVTMHHGKLIFNQYAYSATTARHQWKTRKLLNSLNTAIDMFVDTRSTLDDPRWIIYAIREAEHKIGVLSDLIDKPKTHKRKNLERRNAIKTLQQHIDALRKL